MSRRELVDTVPPYYLIDGDGVVARYERLHGAFRRHFPRLVVGYSYKTNYVPRLLQVLHEAGAWAEVVSELEYEIALRVGVPPERIVFNGPDKPAASLERALEAGGTVNLDGPEDVAAVERFARRTGWTGGVGVRVNLPHPEGEGHRSRSRFGTPATELPAIRDRLAEAGVRLTGLHGHLSTRSRGLEVVRGVVTELARAARALGTESLEYLDLGGGFGVAPDSMPSLSFPTLEEYAAVCHEALGTVDPALVEKTVIVEPGIAMVGDQVSYLAPVRSVRRIGDRHLAFLDASVHTVKPTRHRHHLPTRAYTSGFELKDGPLRRYDLVGYTCMDDDYVAIGQELPELAPGDVLELGNVGAYTLVFKPPFIRTQPAVYLRYRGALELARSEQTTDELLAGYRWEAT